MDNIVMGIDIGGSHLTACLIDLDKKIILQDSYVRKAIDSSDTSENILSIWANTIIEIFNRFLQPIGKIGIAIPGPFDYVNGISYIKSLEKYDNLYEINVKKNLAQKLSIDITQIRLVNDATAFLLGEILSDTAINNKEVDGITLGTGLGSATFFNGKFEDGDLYSMTFLEGIAEDYLSARWLIATYEEISGRKIEGVKVMADLFSIDHNAQLIFNKFGENLGTLLFHKYASKNPTLIIVGGNISKAHQLFLPIAQSKVLSKGGAFILKNSELGENAALFGAAALWR